MPTKTDETTKKRSTSGWGELAKRQAELAKTRDEMQSRTPEFWLNADESAVVQFLTDDPFCFNAHVLKLATGKFITVPCGLDVRKHCALCASGSKQTWKAAFKILDYRGEWDKEAKKWKKNKCVEKVWVMGSVLATQVKQLIDKKGRDLSTMVFDITRSGNGKNTTYNFEIALDDNDRRVRPVDWKEETPPLEDIFAPMSNDEMEELDYVV